MDLRDELAMQRTILANQRTLLSFLTSALAAAATGLSLIRFFPGHWSYWAGWSLLPVSPALAVYGLRNYSRHKAVIRKACKTHSGKEPEL